MSENRQFVIRVLDVAQGAGAYLQVDDQPPRWLVAWLKSAGVVLALKGDG